MRGAGYPSSPCPTAARGSLLRAFTGRGLVEHHLRAGRIQEGGHTQNLCICEMVGKDAKARDGEVRR